MSVPAPREPGQGSRWETIRYALDTNPRTFRLCLILFVAAVAPCLAVVIAELIRHLVLCGTRRKASPAVPGKPADPLARSGSLRFAPPVSGCRAVNVPLSW
jgi:hypothetical protein